MAFTASRALGQPWYAQAGRQPWTVSPRTGLVAVTDACAIASSACHVARSGTASVLVSLAGTGRSNVFIGEDVEAELPRALARVAGDTGVALADAERALARIVPACGWCRCGWATTWTKIVRHTMVAGRASPDDPALAGYWAKRRERTRPPVSPATWHLLRRQHGRCLLCRGLLLYASHEPHDEREWEQWHTIIRKAVATVMDLGTPDEQAAYHLIHAYCRRRVGSKSSTPARPEATRLA